MGVLANRLRRMQRHLRKWARRTGVTCYRLYDRDIPDHPLLVDWYDGRAVVSAFERKKDLEPGSREAWLEEVRSEVLEALEVPEELLFFKQRGVRRRAKQYARLGDEGRSFVVEEFGLRFQVNLSDYLDTGLFLDHRLTRRRVREEAAGRRVLNLFAYTGSFSVYAAAGGAAEVTTVDLSQRYLDWGRENFRLNGLDPDRFEWVRDDALRWLTGARQNGRWYDLVICDPPTFSNSARMEGFFEVDGGHPELIRRCLSVLAPEGVLYFSTNSRRFRLLADHLPHCRCREITAQLLPEDFRDRRPHRCWEIRHGASGEV